MRMAKTAPKVAPKGKANVLRKGTSFLQGDGERPSSAGSRAPPCCALRVEAPRRVRRCSESARVLHCLDAAVCQVLVALELVGVVLEDPELVAGCLSTSSGAPCTVSWGRAL